jgi:predicted CoA-binding protein
MIDLSTRQSFLKRYRKVVVVGISANPARPSHWIARYLIDNGYDVVGVNPGLPKISGIKVYASIREVPGPLEIVDVFRSPDAIPALVEEVAPLKPMVFWLQPGAENSVAAERARALGILVVEGDCIYADHQAMTGR